MTQRYILNLVGEITTETPFHTSPPGTPKGPGDEIRLPRLMIASRDNEVPVIPAAGIRGRLRRNAVQLVTDSLIAASGGSQSGFRLEDYYQNALGGFAGKSSGYIRKLADREKNPITSLFGCSFQNESRIWINYAKPVLGAETPTYYVRGVRADDVAKSGESEFRLGEEVLIEFLARQEKARGDTKKLDELKDLKKKRNSRKCKGAELDEINARIEVLESETKGPRTLSAQMPLSGFEVIAEGVKFEHAIRLVGVTAVEAGLFIETLRRYSSLPYLGAKTAQGMGLISARYAVEIRSLPSRDPVDAGEIELGGHEGAFSCSPALQPFTDAWDEFIASATWDSFRLPADAIAEAIDDADDDPQN